METPTDIRYDLLKAELALTQAQMDKYDQLSTTTKTWAVTLWVALSGWAFQLKLADVALLGALVALLFWVFDGYHKAYRSAYKHRRDEIQIALRILTAREKLPKEFPVPNLPGNESIIFPRTIFLPHVCLPYLALFIISLIITMRF